MRAPMNEGRHQPQRRRDESGIGTRQRGSPSAAIGRSMRAISRGRGQSKAPGECLVRSERQPLPCC